MKITSDWHYLTRSSTGAWRVSCYRCLMNGRAGMFAEAVSYSGLSCEICGAKHVTPQGSRPPFKMRNVTYTINASYPEYDLTT